MDEITFTAQQIRHFSQFGWIEFEEFLSPTECQKIHEHLQRISFQRAHILSPAEASSERLYGAARDCWREEPWLKKFFLSARLLAVAENLSGKKPLILAYDQWIPEGKTLNPLVLSENFSIQNVTCAVLLSLQGPQIGHARWLTPDRLPLFGTSELLIAYGTLNAVYIQNPRDPCNAFLKQFGYNFGDRIAKECTF